MTPSQESVQFERPKTTSRVHLIAEPVLDNSKVTQPKEERLRGHFGMYRVTYVLCIPGKDAFRESLNVSEIMESGDSLLLFQPGMSSAILTLQDGSQQIVINGKRNARGALASLTLDIQASQFSEAERLGHNVTLPILSRWSFHSDVALEVSASQVEELTTGIIKWSLGVIGGSQMVKVIGGKSVPQYRTIFSAYREALSSTSPFYRLLCFYKVVEGVRSLRDERKKTALEAGGQYRGPDERISQSAEGISSDAFEQDLFRSYVGWKFTKVLDEFRDLFRNAISHLDPMGDSLVIDKYDDFVRCENALPVIKYIAREMVENELKADGSGIFEPPITTSPRGP
jgi:hypothetical protein